jgi:hypothetical protein
MITIDKKSALHAIKLDELLENLIAQGITIVTQKDDAQHRLAALRDSKQRQTTGALYDPMEKAFCCLGLEHSCNWGGKAEIGNDFDGGFLNLPTRRYPQLTDKDYFNTKSRTTEDEEGGQTPSIKNSLGYRVTTSEANDSFKQIADLLEPHMVMYA